MNFKYLFLALFLATSCIQEDKSISVTDKINPNSQGDLVDSGNSSIFTITTPSANQVFGTKAITVEGVAQAGASVSASSSSSNCSTTASGDGSYSCTLSPDLPAGQNLITVSSSGKDLTVTVEIGYPDLCSLPSDVVGRVFFNFANDCQFNASVDNGWMLWLQYYHAGGTQPSHNVISGCNDLPIEDATHVLGADHSSDLTKWGHGSQSFAQKIPDNNIKLRWFGKSEHHNRVIHFESNILGQFRDGSAAHFGPGGISNSFTPLAGHTAHLPGFASAAHSGGGGDTVFTETPLWDNETSGDNAHWSAGDSLGRWYVDSRNTSDFTDDTIHKIWVGCNE
jgi:hypothetical protein